MSSPRRSNRWPSINKSNIWHWTQVRKALGPSKEEKPWAWDRTKCIKVLLLFENRMVKTNIRIMMHEFNCNNRANQCCRQQDNQYSKKFNSPGMFTIIHTEGICHRRSTKTYQEAEVLRISAWLRGQILLLAIPETNRWIIWCKASMTSHSITLMAIVAAKIGL